jgi:hypothetical protein
MGLAGLLGAGSGSPNRSVGVHLMPPVQSLTNIRVSDSGRNAAIVATVEEIVAFVARYHEIG